MTSDTPFQSRFAQPSHPHPFVPCPAAALSELCSHCHQYRGHPNHDAPDPYTTSHYHGPSSEETNAHAPAIGTCPSCAKLAAPACPHPRRAKANPELGCSLWQ
jgi:hypothetical protein